jgi:hypothetical protein
MTKKLEPQKPAQTPFDKFTDAARHVFNLPKDQVEKVKAKYPVKSPKRRKRN